MDNSVLSTYALWCFASRFKDRDGIDSDFC